MSTTTPNLGLTQPEPADGYDVNVFNVNAARIDSAVGGLGERIGTADDAEGTATLFGQIKTLASALATANANIATLLTQTKGVKAIVAGNVQVRDGDAAGTAIVNIPDTMNPERVVVITTSKSSALGDNVTWSRSGRTVTFSATNYYTTITYQFIEFY